MGQDSTALRGGVIWVFRGSRIASLAVGFHWTSGLYIGTHTGMGEKEISIPFAELNRMEVYCGNCGAGAILDWAKQQAILQQCGACGTQFSESARRAMLAYQQFYVKAKDSGLVFQFGVKAP